MIVKVALRNFLGNMKTSIIAIVGLSITLSLVVGALSLSDSIEAWKLKKLEENFGVADAYAEPRMTSFVFNLQLSKKIDEEEIERLKDQVSKVLPVTEGNARINDSLDVIAIGVEPEELSAFLGAEVSIPEGRVILGRSLAEKLGVKVGDTVWLDFVNKRGSFKVERIGESGFLNFKGEGVNSPGTVFLNVRDFPDANFPTKCYLSYGKPVKEHPKIVIDTSLRVKNMKYDFLKSSVNKTLTYFTLAFSSLSILVGLVVFYMFCEDVVSDRKTVLSVLRIIGMRRSKVNLSFLLEGVFYALTSSLTGIFLGVIIGRFLLMQFQSLVEGISFSFFSIDRVDFAISGKTLVVGLLLGLALPLSLFFLRAREIVRHSPTIFLNGFEVKGSRKIISFGLLVLALVFFLVPRLWPSALALLTLFASFSYRRFVVFLSSGTFLLVLNNFMKLRLETEELFMMSLFNKGILVFLGVALLVFSLLPMSRKIMSGLLSRGNLPILMGFSYVSRLPTRGVLLVISFSILIFSTTVLNLISVNIEKFVTEKLKDGIFGFNFLVIKNPMKFLLRGVDIPKHEKLSSPVKVQLFTLKTEKGEKVVAFVSDNFFTDSSLKFSKETLEAISRENTVIVGLKDKEKVPEVLEGKLISLSPMGGQKEVRFVPVATFEKSDIIIPVDVISSIRNAPSDLRTVEFLLGKVSEKNSFEVKKFYMSRFDYPFHIDEEVRRFYSGIEGLMRIIKYVFGFGFVAAIAGLSLTALRASFSRMGVYGMLRAIGMKTWQLITSFLLEYLSFLVVGGVIGTVAGMIFGYDLVMKFFEVLNVPAKVVSTSRIGILTALIYGISLVVISIPAFMAVRMPPNEAIREGE